MQRDMYYILVIVMLIGFSVAVVRSYPVCDCSDAIDAALMIGETKGVIDTLKVGAQ